MTGRLTRFIQLLAASAATALALSACFEISEPFFPDNSDLDSGFPAQFDPSRTSVEVLGEGKAIADGEQGIEVRILLLDTQGRGVPGLEVLLEASGSDNGIDQPPPTDENGSTTGTIYSRRAGRKLISASVHTDLGLIRLPTRPQVHFIPGPASALFFSVQPGSAQAAAPLIPAVEVAVVDRSGNLVSEGSHLIQLDLGSASVTGASLSGTVEKASEFGVASFDDLSVDLVGEEHFLSASAEGLEPAHSGQFTISEGPPARLVFMDYPIEATSGATLSPVRVELQDTTGNRLSSANTPVTLSLKGQPTLLEGLRTAWPDEGVVSFENLKISKAGSYEFIATANGFAGAQSPPITIHPPMPHDLRFQVQPSDTVAGEPISPAIEVLLLDEGGEPLLEANAEVSLFLSVDNGASIRGESMQNAEEGLARFPNVWIEIPDKSYRIQAGVVTARGHVTKESNTFEILAPPPPRLEFSAQPPAEVLAGEDFAVEVMAINNRDHPISSWTGELRVELLEDGVPNPDLELLGTLEREARFGRVHFDDLKINRVAEGLSLLVSGEGLDPVQTQTFTVLPHDAAKVRFDTQPQSSAPATVLPTITLSFLDPFGNLSRQSDGRPVSLSLGRLLDDSGDQEGEPGDEGGEPGDGDPEDGDPEGKAPQGTAQRAKTPEGTPPPPGSNQTPAPLEYEEPEELQNLLSGQLEVLVSNGQASFEDLQISERGVNFVLVARSSIQDAEGEIFSAHSAVFHIGQTHEVQVGPGTPLFDPPTLTIAPGEAVRWNFESEGLTVTSGEDGEADGIFCSPTNENCELPTFSELGDSFEYRFGSEGEFPYFSHQEGSGEVAGSAHISVIEPEIP